MCTCVSKIYDLWWMYNCNSALVVSKYASNCMSKCVSKCVCTCVSKCVRKCVSKCILTCVSKIYE